MATHTWKQLFFYFIIIKVCLFCGMHHVTEAHLCEGKLKCWAGALLPFFTIYAKKTTQTPLDKQTQNPIFVIFVCVSWYFFSWFFTFKFYTKKYRKKSKLLKKQPFFKSFMSRERSRSYFFFKNTILFHCLS